MTAYLTKECGYHASRDDWGLYTNVLHEQATLSSAVGNDKEALAFYLIICYLDINGPNNLGGIGTGHGIRSFDPKMGMVAPGIIEQISELKTSLNLSDQDLKTMFFESARMLHDKLKLPVSFEKAWGKINSELGEE
jgi:hypothetical protein